jgi:hypothetical protein
VCERSSTTSATERPNGRAGRAGGGESLLDAAMDGFRTYMCGNPSIAGTAALGAAVVGGTGAWRRFDVYIRQA